jgi:murein DD-endopeptidase MepM/ murein hydrolase activator NlpD
MKLIDRLLTIVVTATLTSAAWLLFGSFYLEGGATETAKPRPAHSVSAISAAQAIEGGEGLVIPVVGVEASQLSDTFSDRRGGGARAHEALDIMAPAGTPVVAAAPGKIEKLFLSDDGGNTVYIRSADRRTIYYYAHLQAYADGRAEGQQVERGQRIGTVGSTGNADPAAPHLHFAIMQTEENSHWWEPAAPLNPYNMLVARH